MLVKVRVARRTAGTLQAPPKESHMRWPFTTPFSLARHQTPASSTPVGM